MNDATGKPRRLAVAHDRKQSSQKRALELRGRWHRRQKRDSNRFRVAIIATALIAMCLGYLFFPFMGIFD